MTLVPKKFSVLILDDDQGCGEGLRELLDRQGMDTHYFHDPRQGIPFAGQHAFDMAFIDLRMPSMDGLSALKLLKQHHPDLLCIMMSGFATIDAAVEAMKDGAYDFLLKPIRKNYLGHVLQKLTDKLELVREIKLLREQLDQSQTDLIGLSPPMVALRKMVKRVAKSHASVLIMGESGTGKEIVVDLLHHFSDRRAKPLVKINCAAIPANLVEAELFGFVKGSFTGAAQDKTGRFEQADGGTLFLDEIGELPPSTQVKILRVLQDQMVCRIGATQEKKVDVRIVSATNQDLHKLIETGQFREDLFYRLNVVPIPISPLRERTEDIPLLMRYFVDAACQKYQKPEKWFTRKALAVLMQHHWPGNVRELKHLCEQLVITTSGRWISESTLPKTYATPTAPPPSGPSIQIPYGTSLDSATQHIIQQTLTACGNDIEKAAQVLGIHPRTIRRKLPPEQTP